ncbi:hypothetical protein KIW84_042004 [Lathyrus oleraceus]|uniref:Uncharacterized protein n=1 Tax=Pisum sativum TaxID=3888 RepID=A0A9D5AST6_PEA|nr:hypothetical protein KIW84_042004 [Pisum sativum]
MNKFANDTQHNTSLLASHIPTKESITFIVTPNGHLKSEDSHDENATYDYSSDNACEFQNEDENNDISSSFDDEEEFGSNSTLLGFDNIVIDQCNLIYIRYSCIGDPLIECTHCGTLMWYQEQTGKQRRTIVPKYQIDRWKNLQPTNCFEVAACIVGDVDTCFKRDILLERHNGRLKKISEFHPSYLAYHYPLLFPYKEDGFRPEVLHRETNKKEEAKGIRLPSDIALHLGFKPELTKFDLPYAHILLFLHLSSKYLTTGEINKIISAEIPSEEDDMELYHLVKTHMIHGPYGLANRCSPCMKNGKCYKYFLKKFQPTIVVDRDGYPMCIRRENGNTIMKRYVSPSEACWRLFHFLFMGPTCYEDIKDVSGKVLDSFRDACFEMGFLEDDNEYAATINEAKDWGFGHFLRKLFVTMLLSSNIDRPRHIWERNWSTPCDDILYKQRNKTSNTATLTSHRSNSFNITESEPNGKTLSTKNQQKNKNEPLPDCGITNGEQRPVVALGMNHSPSVSGDLHGVQPDPIAIDILRKELEHETFARLIITPIEVPLPDEMEAYMVLQECLEMRRIFLYRSICSMGKKGYI